MKLFTMPSHSWVMNSATFGLINKLATHCSHALILVICGLGFVLAEQHCVTQAACELLHLCCSGPYCASRLVSIIRVNVVIQGYYETQICPGTCTNDISV